MGKLSSSDFYSLVIFSIHLHILPQYKYSSVYKSVWCLNFEHLQFISKSDSMVFTHSYFPHLLYFANQNELMLGFRKLGDHDVHKLRWKELWCTWKEHEVVLVASLLSHRCGRWKWTDWISSDGPEDKGLRKKRLKAIALKYLSNEQHIWIPDEHARQRKSACSICP